MAVKIFYDPETGTLEFELSPQQEEEISLLFLAGMALAGAMSADICSSPARYGQAAETALTEARALLDLIEEEKASADAEAQGDHEPRRKEDLTPAATDGQAD